MTDKPKQIIDIRRIGNPADIEELEEWPKDPKDMCNNE